MKHFSLGLAVGAGFGMVLSLFKDQNGHRLGRPIQKQFSGTKNDLDDLTQAINKLKIAQQELTDALPNAQIAYTELEKEIEYYQISISRLISKLQEQAGTLKKEAY